MCFSPEQQTELMGSQVFLGCYHCFLFRGYGNLSCAIFQHPHAAQLYFVHLFKGFCLNHSEPQKLSQIMDWSSSRHSGNIIRELSSKNVSLEEYVSVLWSFQWCYLLQRASCEHVIGVLWGQWNSLFWFMHSPLIPILPETLLFFKSSNRSRLVS